HSGCRNCRPGRVRLCVRQPTASAVVAAVAASLLYIQTHTHLRFLRPRCLTIYPQNPQIRHPLPICGNCGNCGKNSSTSLFQRLPQVCRAATAATIVTLFTLLGLPQLPLRAGAFIRPATDAGVLTTNPPPSHKPFAHHKLETSVS